MCFAKWSARLFTHTHVFKIIGAFNEFYWATSLTLGCATWGWLNCFRQFVLAADPTLRSRSVTWWWRTRLTLHVHGMFPFRHRGLAAPSLCGLTSCFGRTRTVSRASCWTYVSVGAELPLICSGPHQPLGPLDAHSLSNCKVSIILVSSLSCIFKHCIKMMEFFGLIWKTGGRG